MLNANVLPKIALPKIALPPPINWATVLGLVSLAVLAIVFGGFLATDIPSVPLLFEETLDVDMLLNMNKIFGYSNTLFKALKGIVWFIAGFALARMVIRFVMSALTSFSF